MPRKPYLFHSQRLRKYDLIRHICFLFYNPDTFTMKNKLTIYAAIIVALILVGLNFSIWSYINNPLQLKPWTKMTMGLTFDPMRKHDTQTNGSYPSEADIDKDLALLQDKVYAVRTYSLDHGLDKIPELAEKHHLNVALGLWIGPDLENNRQELMRLYKTLAENHKNIVRVLVGNEALLRTDVTEEQLITYLREVRLHTRLPVSTSATWDEWMQHPHLVDEVDYIAVHILPFWNGVSARQAVDTIFGSYHALEKQYPGKPIVITEVGWPSSGQAIKEAFPSRKNQAEFLRNVIRRAEEERISYYIVEAFDQPWKAAYEGAAGAYWGVFDSDRQPKYPLNGRLVTIPGWTYWAVGASLLSALLMAILLITKRSLKLPGVLFFGVIANLAASTIFWSVSMGAERYQTSFSLFFFSLMLLMQILATLVLLVETLEIVEVLWHRKAIRTAQPLEHQQNHTDYPKVSLHLPIHNEPPYMVKQTLEALAKLDYPALEVLVIDNNTKDPAIWQPIQAICEQLGVRFRFFHLDNWPGFKAGAMNYALEQNAQDAEIIAVIDSDYIVSPSWLKDMIPYFSNPKVAFVQSPQDYRDGSDNIFKTCCYWEYAGFFNIGMIQRDLYNAIIQHGTMTLIRKEALLEVGRWAEWCITEDSELGLSLYEAGYESVYLNQSQGKGVMPDTFAAYKGQRFRWVYGAMQIIKKHWRSFLPGRKSSLTAAQRYYFLAGWLPWFSDALALIFAIASVIMTGVLLYDPQHIEMPSTAFLLPTVGIFSFKLVRGLWLYRARVPCSLMQTLGSFLAGLSLTHTVARAVLQGLFTHNKPFLRTPKLEQQSMLVRGLLSIWQELMILTALSISIIAVASVDYFHHLMGHLWMTVLAVQLTPYLATVVMLWISLSKERTQAQ